MHLLAGHERGVGMRTCEMSWDVFRIHRASQGRPG
jgi:hypothetical protein